MMRLPTPRATAVKSQVFLASICIFTVFAMFSVYERAMIALQYEVTGRPHGDSYLQQMVDDPFRSADGDDVGNTDRSVSDSLEGRITNTWSARFTHASYSAHPMYVTSLAEGLLRGSAGNPGGIAIVTMVNAAWLDMLEHMIYSALTRGNISSILVVALDEAGLSACLYNLSLPMPCLDGSQYVGDIGDQSEKLLNTAEYVKVTWARPKLVLDLLQYDIPILNVDTDVVFYHAINPLVDTGCSATAAFSCSCEFGFCNMGLYLIRPSSLTRNFWQTFLLYEDDYFNDQEMYQRIEHLLPEVNKCCLRIEEFDNSCHDPHSSLLRTPAIAWHAICMTGLATKREHFIKREGWLLSNDPEQRLRTIHAVGRAP